MNIFGMPNFLKILFVLFKGKLERTSVLKAICAGFKETTEPQVCLSEGQCVFIHIHCQCIDFYTVNQS
jgi:hypothetical protein